MAVKEKSKFVQSDEIFLILGPEIDELFLFGQNETRGIVDMKRRADTLGYVAIIHRRSRRRTCLKKACRGLFFAGGLEKRTRREKAKKSKKLSEKVLRFFGKSNIMQWMSAKGMKRQIAHWPVRELSRTMSANRTTAQESVMQGNSQASRT